MIYYYDGSWENLLTLFFYLYPKSAYDIDIRLKSDNLSFFKEELHPTEEDKVERIINYVKKEVSYQGVRRLMTVFMAEDEKKEMAMFQALKAMCKTKDVHPIVADDLVIHFNSLYKKIMRERHFYLGLLRFKELKGNILYGGIRPEHDVLLLLVNHFMNRMPNEHIIIEDVGRKKAVEIFQGDSNLIDISKIEKELEDNEENIQENWQSFYNSVTIKSRENLSLRQSNLPKKYWEFLTELR